LDIVNFTAVFDILRVGTYGLTPDPLEYLPYEHHVSVERRGRFAKLQLASARHYAPYELWNRIVKFAGHSNEHIGASNSTVDQDILSFVKISRLPDISITQ
jgi:hypothetical protein